MSVRPCRRIVVKSGRYQDKWPPLSRSSQEHRFLLNRGLDAPLSLKTHLMIALMAAMYHGVTLAFRLTRNAFPWLASSRESHASRGHTLGWRPSCIPRRLPELFAQMPQYRGASRLPKHPFLLLIRKVYSLPLFASKSSGIARGLLLQPPPCIDIPPDSTSNFHIPPALTDKLVPVT